MATTKVKRQRIDSANGALELHANLRDIQALIKLPAHLTEDGEQKHFWSIIQSREAQTWLNPLDVTVAANLAITLHQLDISNDFLRQYGMVTENQRGTPVVSPHLTAKSQLAGQALQLQRALGLSASARGLSGEDQQKRNKADRDVRQVMDRVGVDDLLA